MKRITVLLAALFALLLCGRAAAEKIITLTFAGDCTLGTEEATRRASDSFDSVARKKGYDYFFANFYDIFSQDDCTVVNCEGVLSDSSMRFDLRLDQALRTQQSPSARRAVSVSG